MKIVATTFMLMLSATVCLGVWAKHEVISIFTREYGVSILPAVDDIKKLDIVLAPAACSIPKDNEPPPKGYFLIKTTTRRGQDALNFRMALSSWKEHLAGRERHENAKQQGIALPPQYVPKSLEGIESISRLQPSIVDGQPAIAVQLTPEIAMRSYIVYDFIFLYESGGFVVDGGLWLTYDLPSLTEAAGMVPKQTPETK